MAKDALLSNPIFHDADKAREWLEVRLWPQGPICPKCGSVDEATLMQGKSHRAGLYQCNACHAPFTVTMGTLYERSHVPLNKWLFATQLLMSAKNGISANEVGRTIGVSKKTAWFLMHRIRESLRVSKDAPQLGGAGKTVEGDEAYIGGKAANRKGHVPPKEATFALVERGGKVRSTHVHYVNGAMLRIVIRNQMDAASRLMTDSGTALRRAGEVAAEHHVVNHSIQEYVRPGTDIHTNTVEGYFSVLKRTINGSYIHVSAEHLKRYLCEVDYRYNERTALGVSDQQRMEKSIPGIVGKRLTYRRISGPQASA